MTRPSARSHPSAPPSNRSTSTGDVPSPPRAMDSSASGPRTGTDPSEEEEKEEEIVPNPTILLFLPGASLPSPSTRPSTRPSHTPFPSATTRATRVARRVSPRAPPREFPPGVRPEYSSTPPRATPSSPSSRIARTRVVAFSPPLARRWRDRATRATRERRAWTGSPSLFRVGSIPWRRFARERFFCARASARETRETRRREAKRRVARPPMIERRRATRRDARGVLARLGTDPRATCRGVPGVRLARRASRLATRESRGRRMFWSRRRRRSPFATSRKDPTRDHETAPKRARVARRPRTRDHHRRSTRTRECLVRVDVARPARRRRVRRRSGAGEDPPRVAKTREPYVRRPIARACVRRWRPRRADRARA